MAEAAIQVATDFKPDTLYSEIAAMRIGQIREYPIKRMNSIRATASNVSMMTGFEYKTKTDRASQLIRVRREN